MVGRIDEDRDASRQFGRGGLPRIYLNMIPRYLTRDLEARHGDGRSRGADRDLRLIEDLLNFTPGAADFARPQSQVRPVGIQPYAIRLRPPLDDTGAGNLAEPLAN